MEVVRGVGSGLGGLYVKGALPGQLLTISRKQLTLVAGGSPSNVSKAPTCQNTRMRIAEMVNTPNNTGDYCDVGQREG